MSPRVAIAGIAHEALTFVPNRATLEDFEVWRGDDVLDVPGVGAAVTALGFEAVPLSVANSHTPGGPVALATYGALKDEILNGLADAGGLDAVCLVLHGSMLVEGLGSGETDLVRAVRQVVGPAPLIGARFDLHANVTSAFANLADVWAGYRTAPHRDIPETFGRVAARLMRALEAGERPRPVFVPLPLLLPGELATTDVEPMRSLLARARALEQQHGVLGAEVLVGFGWADAPHAGASVTVFATGSSSVGVAEEAALALAAEMWARRAEFAIPHETAASVDEAIARALAASERTVFVTDTGDNPTAGATGDVPYFLSRLLELQVPDAVLAGMCDAAAYGACVAAGVGGVVSTTLGGKIDTLHGPPVAVTGVVEHLYTPPPGLRHAVPIATLRVDGVLVLIPAQRHSFYHLADFHRAGVEPLDHKLVVVKLGYLFPELHDIAPREILALSPGSSDLNLSRLPFEALRRPIYPFDPDMTWEPRIASRS